MVVGVVSSPFGAQTRTRALLALRLLGDSYPRELARLLESRLSGVQKALRSLEVDGLVAARSVGRIRLYQLNPRYFAADALFAYLSRLSDPEERLKDRAAELRRRPRLSSHEPGAGVSSRRSTQRISRRT
jgi:DNA-binding transcriptional ArsR family regulator